METRTSSTTFKKLTISKLEQSNVVIISPKKFLALSGSLISFFLAAHFVGISLINNYPGLHIAKMVNKFFNLDYEATFPSFFSAILLFFSALLSFLISTQKNIVKYHKHWLVLGFVLVFLCLDEATSIHEEFIGEIQVRLFEQRGFSDLNGFLYFGWVIPYALLIAAVGLYFFKFVLSLPSKIRNLFILAGCVYISGALGCELIEGYYKKNDPSDTIMMGLYISVEEILEMCGLSIFVYALLYHIGSLNIELNFGKGQRKSSPKIN
jgi:hypothetical protein